jgi:diguanylate cyclase (GGDEF)-like protein
MIDVDHFKHFNDAYGHEAGDMVLRELGLFLSSQIRGEDIPCRYGGEEFILILPGAPLEVTKLRAEKLRAGIQQLSLVFKGQALGSITVSLGVAIYPAHGTSAESIIRAADTALYRAKKAGRNRIAVAEIA